MISAIIAFLSYCEASPLGAFNSNDAKSRLTDALAASQGPPSLSNFSKECLSAHNYYRKMLNLAPYTWDSAIEQKAQHWADQLASKNEFKHSGSGENLYQTTNGDFSCKAAVKAWFEEYKHYNGEPIGKGDFHAYGHFTQVIWPTTGNIGCGFKKYASGSGQKQTVVCQYSPAGNILGQSISYTPSKPAPQPIAPRTTTEPRHSPEPSPVPQVYPKPKPAPTIPQVPAPKVNQPAPVAPNVYAPLNISHSSAAAPAPTIAPSPTPVAQPKGYSHPTVTTSTPSNAYATHVPSSPVVTTSHLSPVQTGVPAGYHHATPVIPPTATTAIGYAMHTSTSPAGYPQIYERGQEPADMTTMAAHARPTQVETLPVTSTSKHPKCYR